MRSFYVHKFDEVKEWCEKNCSGNWVPSPSERRNGGIISLEDDSDYILFKMTFITGASTYWGDNFEIPEPEFTLEELTVEPEITPCSVYTLRGVEKEMEVIEWCETNLCNEIHRDRTLRANGWEEFIVIFDDGDRMLFDLKWHGDNRVVREKYIMWASGKKVGNGFGY